MHGTDKSKWMLRAELLLWGVGALCAVFCAIVGIRALASAKASRHFPHLVPVQAAPQDTAQTIRVDPWTDGSKPGAVIGRLEIPQLALSVPIVSDYQSSSLLKGIGHIPGTALPGGLGTMGLAGHRDTYFRPLRNIKPRMEIRIASPSGTYHYQVDSTEIVTPEQVEVLDIRSQPEMVLITCYPFYYVGSAPKRFIVHAHLLSALPDAS